MVTKFENKQIPVKEYKSQVANAGKVAIFNFDDSTLFAEGNSETDWLELELLCEDLRETGNFRIVIVPEAKPSIKAAWKIVE